MINVATLRLTCESCPTQYEGSTTDGKYIYIRYRWGYLRADIGDNTIFGLRIGDELDGCLDYDRMVEVLADVLDFSNAKVS